MKRIITSEVDSHHTNPNYVCLLYEFVDDPTFHLRYNEQGQICSLNWMPKESDVLEIAKDLLRVSPTFGPKLLTLTAGLTTKVSRSGKVITKDTNLAELMV